ncbi:MAG: metallopeptidase TldD-related protein [Terracidiphilus sp.]|nr:metallopeptidase TldD-related protein [Terracidiphilus sp.]
MLLRRFALAALAASLAVPSLRAAEPTRADAEKDPILKAMLTELDRSMTSLQLKDFQKPFFLQYRVEDIDDFDTRAGFGASQGSNRSRARVLRVTVLVGDYKTDSSTPRGDGAAEMATFDDDPIALRSALWAATDQAYKAALATYAQKQAELKQVQTPPQADDLSHEKPVISLTAPATLTLDPHAETDWTARVARWSGLYRSDASVKTLLPDIEYSSAAFHARSDTTRLVNSEGTIVRKGETVYTESFAAGTQAADGMHLDRSNASSGVVLADIDAPDSFEKHAIALIDSLGDLKQAPVIEDEYHGPVLLSADASATALNRLLGSSVLATRPRLGTEARTGSAFASSYHARVLPDFLDVVDDPTLATYDGKRLLGSYTIDDEGVPAQPVPLVVAGKLENYLIGRQPVRDFPQSNGHARASIAGPAHPMPGVLKISAKDGLSDDALQKKLQNLAKERELKNVYYVETMGGPVTPRLVYRITPDGKRELVRGATLADLDLRALRSSVNAAGNTLWLDNLAGDIPESVLAPALLFDDLTLKKANEKNDKLPFYPAPE